jgi:phosphoglycolate phosphatase-like HAD superfamily hydrolase
MIFRLMKSLGVTDAARVAKVGDTLADLEEGINAGCGLVIGVTSGSHSRMQLQLLAPAHIVESVSRLPALLLSAPRADPGG